MSVFWEPWLPKIGDRVRIRISAECQTRWCRQDNHITDGEVAVVLMSGNDLAELAGGQQTTDGHAYMAGIPADEGRYRCGWYAAIELEPVA